MEKLKLESLFEATASNFKFSLDDNFKPFFEIIHKETKRVPDAVIAKKFQQLWLKTSKEWNDEFGWGGYPSLARWLEILTTKPLTDAEKEKRKKEYETSMRRKAQIIIIWINDPNLEVSFPQRYENDDYSHLKLIIDQYCNVKTKLSKERIKKMAQYLREEFLKNRKDFFTKIQRISEDQQPLLL